MREKSIGCVSNELGILPQVESKVLYADSHLAKPSVLISKVATCGRIAFAQLK
jgi:hypothetical protein